MTSYVDTIERARLIADVDSCTTTGDAEYPGTALEISDEEGNELFHVVVDRHGQRQLLMFPSSAGYRLPLDLLERIIAKAKEAVVPLRSEL